MTNINKMKIEDAVNAVYRSTNDSCLHEASVKFEYVKSKYCGIAIRREIAISRSIKENDLTYKLYTYHDDKPLITVYGYWPVEFVIDVFIKTLEHFYDDYSNEKGL